MDNGKIVNEFNEFDEFNDLKMRITFGQTSGQASLEMTAAFVIVFMLLVAAVRIFAWLNASMVYRQADYEQTRVQAGSAPPQAVDINSQTSTMGLETYNESAYPKLNVFK